MSTILTQLELRFHPDEISKLCQKDFSDSNQPIVYYRIDEQLYPYFGNLYNSITYYMYYKDNYAIGLNGLMPYNTRLGYHPIDIENLRILYNKTTKIPEFIFYSAHAQEGIWLPYNKCKFNNDLLVVYISKYSHALRSAPGSFYRMFGFANDYTSDKGEHIIPLLIQDQTIPYLNIQNEEVFATKYNAFIMPLIIRNKEKLKNEQKLKQNEINKHIL